MINNNRRNILKGTAALAAGTLLPNISFASAPTDKRFIVVMLRGGMDGLMAFPPHGDKDYWHHRTWLALPKPGEKLGIIDLDGFFGLHPSLVNLKKYYDKKQLVIFPATASPYRELGRSHFDAQKMIELGGNRLEEHSDGWINRMLNIYQQDKKIGIAVGQKIPLIMKGEVPVASWEPSGREVQIEEDFIEKISRMYAKFPKLNSSLVEGRRIKEMAEEAAEDLGGMSEKENDMLKNIPAKLRPPRYRAPLSPQSMKVFGKMMAADNGPRVAVIDMGGWDTHVRQGTTLGPMAKLLKGMDETLNNLAESLTDVWDKTAIVVVTEFGRTVNDNSSDGTDHGTASASFIMGGAVKGGKVIGDWPGLMPDKLIDGRDLAPTIDMRSIFKTVLHNHMEIEKSAINKHILPDSEAATIIKGII